MIVKLRAARVPSSMRLTPGAREWCERRVRGVLGVRGGGGGTRGIAQLGSGQFDALGSDL